MNKEAQVLSTALELALVVLDASLGYRRRTHSWTRYTALVLAAGEWAGEFSRD